MLWVILYLLERGFHPRVTSRCNASHNCLLNLCLALLHQSILKKRLPFSHKSVFDLADELLRAWIVNCMVNCLLHQNLGIIAHLRCKKDCTFLYLTSSLLCQLCNVDSVFPQLDLGRNQCFLRSFYQSISVFFTFFSHTRVHIST